MVSQYIVMSEITSNSSSQGGKSMRKAEEGDLAALEKSKKS